ncbi:uL13 family ribosomal protein [Candidatus Vidania fulgoroideorum]
MKIFNFKNKIYGRILTKISNYIKKNKFKKILIKNFEKIKLSGNKKKKKNIIYHTNFPGGLKKKNFFKEYIKNKNYIFKSLKGMLPKNSLFKKKINKIIIK